jgi:uncharacterized transporter YbjL
MNFLTKKIVALLIILTIPLALAQIKMERMSWMIMVFFAIVMGVTYWANDKEFSFDYWILYIKYILGTLLIYAIGLTAVTYMSLGHL